MTTTESEITAEVDPEWASAFRQGYCKTMLGDSTREYSNAHDAGWPVEAAWWQDGRDPEWALSAFTPQSREMIRGECDSFAAGNWELLEGLDPEQAGHDFALTRNGAGEGFWSRGLGEKGVQLTETAHAYGESSGWLREGENTVRLFEEPAILASDGNVCEPEPEPEPEREREAG
jgi:hypothetical protein